MPAHPEYGVPARRRLRRTAVPAALVILAAVMVTVQVRYKQRPDPDAVRGFARGITNPGDWIGRVAPDFEVRLLDGRSFRLADEVGRRPIVVNFFTTWCGPCQAEAPELERFHRAKADEVLLLGLDVEEKQSLVEQFVRTHGLSFAVGIDESGDIQKQYDVAAFPTTVLIGVDGRVKVYETGGITNTDVTFGSALEAERGARASGRGVTRQQYLDALASAPRSGTTSPAPLVGDARRIAEAMPCPCGCDDRVAACGCRTAKGIKARLAQGGLDGRSDAAVMEALNREFCMKGM